jgi:Xaa-Pro aminopeptidase
MAFSVEPGFYLEGAYGARIEDIVIAAGGGPIVANHRTRDLVIV